MAFDFDPADRAAFRAAMVAAVQVVFPDAKLAWIAYDRRLRATFPDGTHGSIWEPNFYFSRSGFTDDELFAMVIAHITDQRQALTRYS